MPEESHSPLKHLRFRGAPLVLGYHGDGRSSSKLFRRDRAQHAAELQRQIGEVEQAFETIRADRLVIAWAGWDHLQQAQALAEYYLDAKENQGWGGERLRPLLAGLADLIPWLRQWHNEPNPDYGMGLGDYFAGFLEEQCRGLGWTVAEAEAGRLGGQ